MTRAKDFEVVRRALEYINYETQFEPCDDYDEGTEVCPWCGGIQWAGGHRNDCQRKRALEALKRLETGDGNT